MSVRPLVPHGSVAYGAFRVEPAGAAAEGLTLYDGGLAGEVAMVPA